MPEIPRLSVLEKDLLTELFNLGIGKAAHSLSRMINQEITLSVPEVRIANSSALAELLSKEDSIITIAQSIHGRFDAKAILMFPECGGIEVVKQILGSELSDEALIELQEEALSETGNVVLNACVGTLSQSMGLTFELGIPVFNICSADQILDLNSLAANESILLINIDMALKSSKIDSFIAFVVNKESLTELRNSLTQLINSLYID